MKNTFKKKRLYFILTPVLLIAIIVSSFIISSHYTSKVKAANLMKGIKAGSVDGKAPDNRFVNSIMDFSVDLFQKTRSNEENSLVSPTSIYIALSMTANGSDKETLAQMEAVLGKDITIEEMNHYLYYYVNHLPDIKKSKLKIANSIWYRKQKGFEVNPSFLQTNADCYKAGTYESPFDAQTKADINHWVKANTEGLIDQIIDQINPNNVMYIINTILFDATWETVYEKNNVHKIEFHNLDGSVSTIDGMNSDEQFYLEDDLATGFEKSYYNDKYRFVALLPNKDITLDDYIKQLSGDKLATLLKNPQTAMVSAVLPKFKYQNSIKMNDALQKLGIQDAFSPDKADFSKMAISDQGNLYIDEVLQKTFISVDELGTKAGAVTVIAEKASSAPGELKSVILDRPFFYAIIDTSNNIPIFMGTVTNLK